MVWPPVTHQDVEDAITALQEGGVGGLTYANALAGSRYSVFYNGTTPASRPSARTDIYFEVIITDALVTEPTWMITGDTSLIVG